MPTTTTGSRFRGVLLLVPLIAGLCACSSSGGAKPATAAGTTMGTTGSTTQSTAAGAVTPGTEPAGPAASSAAAAASASAVPSAAAAASIAAGTQQCGTVSFAAATPLVVDDVVAKHVSCTDAGKIITGALGKRGGAYEVAPFHCPAAEPHDNAGTYSYTCTDSSGAQVSFTAPDALAVSTASPAIS